MFLNDERLCRSSIPHHTPAADKNLSKIDSLSLIKFLIAGVSVVLLAFMVKFIQFFGLIYYGLIIVRKPNLKLLVNTS